VTEHLLAAGPSSPAVGLWVAIGLSAIALGGACIALRIQRAALGRVEERVSHLTAGLSLLTNTTEEGLRGVALEIGRLARVAGPAEPTSPAAASPRQRIATAAGHGRSVSDIAASEELSESEVLLHLLLDKLRPEGGNAHVC
jgi:hypothetical protein